ncbi:hypothetical protein KQI89_07580 [Clostridium sp. MSJ-4]|uniref:Uncharacterized protein n=1 Tax=Clostridium simiarum TaxID=2841506 RepID=A0ABS6F217_9CLOT|nr:hypothetical protein [Clostridium simiarum]
MCNHIQENILPIRKGLFNGGVIIIPPSILYSYTVNQLKKSMELTNLSILILLAKKENEYLIYYV